MTGPAILCFIVIVLAATLRALGPRRGREDARSRPTRTPLPLLGRTEPTLDLAGAPRPSGSRGRTGTSIR